MTTEFAIPYPLHTNRNGPVHWIFSHSIYHWWLILVMLIGAISNAVLASIPPVLIGRALNNIVAQPPQTNQLFGIAVVIAATQILRGILQFSRNFSAELIAQRIERDIRAELYTNLLGKSMTFHSLQPIGDTMARATNDVREVNFLFSPGLNLVIGSAFFMIIPLIIAPRYYPSLIITPIAFIIAYFIAIWLYLRELNPVTTSVRATFGKLNTRLAEALDGVETVKGISQENYEVELFRENATNLRNSTIQQGNIEGRFIPVLLLGIILPIGFLHAILLYQANLIQIGDVVAYFSLLTLFSFPTFTSIFAYSQISLGIAGARRILELINRENTLDQNLGGYSGIIEGKVEFQNIDFLYNGTNLAIHGLSCIVKPGQTVAIVGQTGAGKTTLIKLINRTYDASKGRIFIDGIDVRSWNLESLRRQISIIEQDVFLFSRTISENIAFGKPDATQDEIVNAAIEAQADEFIRSFKDSYQTIIGERGVTLSGGQRQRIALARAFLTNPRILILDDSTSSIDSNTEDKIQRAIFAAAYGRTTFIITHRLSQIRWADIIIVLRQGNIAALGDHETLMRTSIEYQQIFSEFK